jgi:uncharacterized DUF497 family protein
MWFLPDPNPGTSKQANPTTSWRKNHISSSSKNEVTRNSDRDQSATKVIKPSSTSYPDILGSSQAKIALVDSVTPPQEKGWEKLLGALNLKEAHQIPSNSKPKGNEMDTGIYSKSLMTADKSESMKSKSEFILQNVDKYPASPQLMTLVNLTRNLANSGHSPSTHITGIIEGTDKQCSEIRVTQKCRETPQRTVSQGRTGSKRTSLSTPRKQKHVRALDFTTPIKARTIPKDLHPKEPSPKTIKNLSKTLQRTTSSALNKARSSLFKSPLGESEKTTVSGAPLLITVSSFSSSDNCHNSLPPIATRSPLPHLIGGWDSAAGVGQIICDDITVTEEATFGSNSSVTATEDDKNLPCKPSGITERTRQQQNRGTRCKVTAKLAKKSWAKNRSLTCPKKSWDSDLRAHLNTDVEGVQLSTNDSCSTKINTKKKKTKTSKPRRKSSKKTQVKVRMLKKRFNKDANMGSGGTNSNKESTNDESGNIVSTSVTPINKSCHSSEKSDLGTEAETQNRGLNIEDVVQVKGKSDLTKKIVEPATDNDHTHVELKEKMSVEVSGQPKKCVSVDALNEKEDSIQPTDLQDSQVTRDQAEAVMESHGEDQAAEVQRKDNFAPEIAASKNVELSKSSDSRSVETVSSSTSVASVLSVAVSSEFTHSPAVMNAAEKNTAHHNLRTRQSNRVDDWMCMIHSDDLGNDTDTVAHASEIDRESTGDTVSETDDHHVAALQSQELVSSTSGVYPAESQNKDLQTSQDCKSVSGKEQSFRRVQNNPPSKTPRTRKQTRDAVNKLDLQVRSTAVPNLDTPRKTDDPGSTCSRTELVHVPLTPRVMSPRPDDTPVTKAANGNSRIDFSLIQTPSFPPTPNIAVTPESCCSSQGTPPSYATRSTDHSICSSYYRPSDRLDSCSSTKPLEELLIEECRKLENRTAVQTSCAFQESNKANTSEYTDAGQCQPLSVTDNTPEEANRLSSDSLSDLQTARQVEKEPVSGKAVERLVDSLVGAPKRVLSPQDQNRAEETQKIDRGSNLELEETNISTRKEAGSVFSSGNTDIAVKHRPSEMCTSAKWKVRFISSTGNKNSDFEGKSCGAQTFAAVSTKRKRLSISKKSNKSGDSEDKTSETRNSASLSAEENSVAIPKTGNTSSKSEAKPSETHALAAVSTKRRTRASKSSDHDNGSSRTRAMTAVTMKRKAKRNSRPANKSSKLEDELSGTLIDLYKEPDEKTKYEIIQKHLEAARTNVFGCTSPSDDSDFESSNDFGQIEAGSKTASCNDENNESYRELTKAKQSSTGQEERVTVGNFSNSHSNTDTQQMVATERQTDEVRPVSSRLAQEEEKSPRAQASACGAQTKKLNTFENDGAENLSDHNQSTDGFRKLSPHSRNDDSHTYPAGKNISSNSGLDEKKHRVIAESKEVDVASSMPNTKDKELVEQDDEVKTVADVLGPSSMTGNNNSSNEGQDVGGRKQLGDEDSVAKTATIIPMNRKSDGVTSQAKKHLHLCVEAIVERLTKEKVAVESLPMIQTPICESVTFEDSTSEDFPALHLSSDEETQCEGTHFSQVESQVANLHGGEETTADCVTVRSPPRSASDVCKDLEVTPIKFYGVESGPKSLQADSELQDEGQELKCEKQLDTDKRKKGGSSRRRDRTNDCKSSKKEPSLSERQESINKKIRALLGNDVSPIKKSREVRKACKGKKREILRKPQTDAGKDNSPIPSTLEIELQEKKLEESLKVNSEVKKVHDIKMLSKREKASHSNRVKKRTKSLETCTNGENDSVECRAATLVESEGPSRGGTASLDTAVMYERRQVSDNEVYIGIVYADEGPKGNSLAFENICKFSLTFELGEDPDGVAETYKCTVSEFQELFYASPAQRAIESDSYESGQFDVERKNSSGTCKEDKHLGHVKNSEVRDKESLHESRSVGPCAREDETRSRYLNFKRSTDFSHYRVRSPEIHWRPLSPGRSRQTFFFSHGRRSQSLDCRSPSSSEALSTSRMSTFSPLHQLYDEYLRDERDSARFTSHYSKRHLNFRSREELPFGRRGKGKTKYRDRYNHPRSSLDHFSRESSHSSSTSSSSSSHGMSDSHNRTWKHSKEHQLSANKMSTQEWKPKETRSRRHSADTASLLRTLLTAKDMRKEPTVLCTQIKGAVDGKQEMQDTDDSLEEGELVDEDSMDGLSTYKSNDNQKYPSSGNFTR